MTEDIKTEESVVKTSLDSMKSELVDLITQAKATGHSFEETPTLFKWTYEEHPDVQIQMLIKGVPKVVEKEEKSLIILNS